MSQRFTKRAPPDPHLFNSAVLFNGSGDVSGWYDKHVLMPIGEAPISVSLPGIGNVDLVAPVTRYESGTHDPPLRLGDHELSAMICYEDLLPAHVRRLTANGSSELLVSMSSDAWFEKTRARELHSSN